VAVFVCSTNQPVVLIVCTDPEPENPFRRFGSEGAETTPDSHRPVLADALEVERWVLRVPSQQLVIFTGELLKLRWQIVEVPPEPA
jgi:hypothetical protein